MQILNHIILYTPKLLLYQFNFTVTRNNAWQVLLIWHIKKKSKFENYFLIVDEAEVAKRKCINVLVVSLDTLNDKFLIDCLPLESGSNVNSSIILHTVDDILRQFETKRKNFALLLTDAARYISLAGKILKKLYPFLMHVTCVAHLLHNCAMRLVLILKILMN